METTGNRAGAQEKQHQVLLKARHEMLVEGVRHVDSFDEHELVLDTELGVLTVKGSGMQMRQLDLDKGVFSVEGRVDSIEYSEAGEGPKVRGRGILERIFK